MRLIKKVKLELDPLKVKKRENIFLVLSILPNWFTQHASILIDILIPLAVEAIMSSKFIHF